MKALELAGKIGLPCEKIRLDYDIADMLEKYHNDRESFFQRVTQIHEYRQKLLQLFLTLAAAAYDKYKMLGIEENIFFDTMKDITIWCGNCQRDCGIWGIQEYGWLWRHVELKLFRLGRLQFEFTFLDRDIKINKMFRKGTLVFNVHVPQGEPLLHEECMKSYKQAQVFFRGMTEVYLCDSWLLNPILKEILSPDSNIIKFQSDYWVYSTNDEERQCEERVFNKILEDPNEYEASNTLQKKVKQLLMEKRKIGVSHGAFML